MDAGALPGSPAGLVRGASSGRLVAGGRSDDADLDPRGRPDEPRVDPGARAARVDPRGRRSACLDAARQPHEPELDPGGRRRTAGLDTPGEREPLPEATRELRVVREQPDAWRRVGALRRSVFRGLGRAPSSRRMDGSPARLWRREHPSSRLRRVDRPGPQLRRVDRPGPQLRRVDRPVLGPSFRRLGLPPGGLRRVDRPSSRLRRLGHASERLRRLVRAPSAWRARRGAAPRPHGDAALCGHRRVRAPLCLRLLRPR
ncbi:MAG: hypothetical protein H6741_22700 [Alphaproteobacteria bacterium]|nr:hypothetical protein [Alphaproteobacteria bacterium]